MSILVSLKNSWDERSDSDKKVLSLVAVLIACSLFYLLVYEPLVKWREYESKRLTKNDKVYSQVERLVSRLQSQKTTTSKHTRDLSAIVDASLQKNSIAMRGFQPGKNNTARLRLANVSYESLVQWLYDVEYVHNLIIEELSIAKTKADNLLMVNIRLRKI